MKAIAEIETQYVTITVFVFGKEIFTVHNKYCEKPLEMFKVGDAEKFIEEIRLIVNGGRATIHLVRDHMREISMIKFKTLILGEIK